MPEKFENEKRRLDSENASDVSINNSNKKTETKRSKHRPFWTFIPRKTRAGKSSLSKSSVFQNGFRPRKAKPAFSNSFRLKSVFEKLRFHDGLVQIVGLTVKNKSAFSNFSGVEQIASFPKAEKCPCLGTPTWPP